MLLLVSLSTREKHRDAYVKNLAANMAILRPDSLLSDSNFLRRGHLA